VSILRLFCEVAEFRLALHATLNKNSVSDRVIILIMKFVRARLNYWYGKKPLGEALLS